jgi:hypothetical protein
MKLPVLLTIHLDGSVSGVPASATETPVFGVWIRTGWKTVASTGLFMALDPATGAVTGFRRSRASLEFSDDFNRYTGTEFIDQLACPSALTCPDPLDPAADWQPVPGMPATGFSTAGARVEVVKSGPPKR